MHSLKDRIHEEEAAVSELERRVAEQTELHRQAPSHATEAVLNALQRSLELGRKHLLFEQEKMCGRAGESGSKEIVAAKKQNHDVGQVHVPSSFHLDSKRQVEVVQTRLAEQLAIVETCNAVGAFQDLEKERGKLSTLQHMLDLSLEISRLELELGSDTEQPQHMITYAEPMGRRSNIRVLDVSAVEFTDESSIDTSGMTELERNSLVFAQAEQKRGLSPKEILNSIKNQHYPLDFYNSQITQSGYSFAIRLPRGNYLMYQDQLSEWLISQKKPDWL